MIRKLLTGLLVLAAALAPVQASRFTLVAPGAGSGGGGGGSFALTWKGNFASSANATSYTATAADLGAAEGGRVIIVAVACGSSASQSITSVSVGGVAASGAVTNPAGTRLLDIWYVVVPTGSTGDIVVTADGSMQRCSFDWWAVTGTDDTTYAARSGASPDTGSPVNSITTTSMTVPTGGASISACMSGSVTGGPITWTMSSGSVAERSDAANEGLWWSTADSQTTGALTYTCDGADSQNYRAAAIAWVP